MAVEKSNSDSACSWTREHDKAFEDAIATYSEDIFDRWEKVAKDVPGKSLEEIKEHYEILIDDITEIESGRVPLPCYSLCSDDSSNINGEKNCKKGRHFGNFNGQLNNGSKGSRLDQERRKGIAWTEDEHKLFLVGLDKYGKGDWRSISRNFVVTRTPTQVASHAQKYFNRLNSMNKERRRSSIHDITTVNDSKVSQGPITGQTNKPPNHSSPPVPTFGQLLATPLVPVVGTPVNFCPPAHRAYGIRVPNHGNNIYSCFHFKDTLL